MIGFLVFFRAVHLPFEILSDNRFNISLSSLSCRDPVLSLQFPFSPRVVLWWSALQCLQITGGGSSKVP